MSRKNVRRESAEVQHDGLFRATLQCVSVGKAEMGECADGFVDYNSAMVEDFLKRQAHRASRPSIIRSISRARGSRLAPKNTGM